MNYAITNMYNDFYVFLYTIYVCFIFMCLLFCIVSAVLMCLSCVLLYVMQQNFNKRSRRVDVFCLYTLYHLDLRHVMILCTKIEVRAIFCSWDSMATISALTTSLKSVLLPFGIFGGKQQKKKQRWQNLLIARPAHTKLKWQMWGMHNPEDNCKNEILSKSVETFSKSQDYKSFSDLSYNYSHWLMLVLLYKCDIIWYHSGNCNSPGTNFQKSYDVFMIINSL